MMSKDESHFVCEVVLPSNSPVTSAVGLSRTTKALAKRSAAFQACLELLKLGQLDQHLLPTIKKYLPAMRNAQLAIKTKRLTGYHMRTKPEHWDSGIGSTPSTLFATLIWLARIEDLSREYWPIMLLTRTKLPNFPSFPIFFLSGSNTDVCTLSLEKPLMMAGGESPSVLHQLTRFTLRIFHHLFNKDYQEDTDRMPYWLAPVALDLKYDATLLNAEPNSLLNHCALNEVANADKMPWSPASDPHTLINRFIVDQNDGGRRFYTQDVSCYTPSDPVPPGSAVAKRLRKDILDYSSSLYRIARENARFDMGQPVYQAEAILHRHNWLDKPNEKERKAARTCFICLEPLKISTVSHLRLCTL